MMDQIFAIVDAQGFSLQRSFAVKELSFWCDDDQSHCVVDTEIILARLSRTDRRTVQYTTNNIHGLTHDFNDDYTDWRQRDVRTIVEEYYLRYSSDEKPCFGLKNPQLAKMLDEWDIPYVPLDNLEIVHCSLCRCYNHLVEPSSERNNLRCAVKKSEEIWVSLKHRLRRRRNCLYL
jgi:hypothetical protein